MIFIRINKSLAAFSPNDSSSVTYYFYFEQIPIDLQGLPWPIQIDVVSHHIRSFSACLSHKLGKLKFLGDSFFEITALVKLPYLPEIIIMLHLAIMTFYLNLRDVGNGVSEKVKGLALYGCMIKAEVAFEWVSAIFGGLLEISFDDFD